MLSLEWLTLAPDVILFTASIALASILTCLFGCTLAWLCRRHEAPVRYAILLTAVCVCALSPLLLAIRSPVKTDWLRFAAPATARQSTAIDSTIGSTVNHPTTVSGDLGTPDSTTVATWRILGTAWIVLWLLGILCGAANALRAIRILRQFLRTLEGASHPRLIAAVEGAFRSIGSARQARIFVTRFAPAPLSLGLFRPIIIVPEYLAVDSTGEQLRFVLTHEVAHVVRRDQWVAVLQCLVTILYWWNPLLRKASRQLSQAREEICDDYVLQAEGDGRRFAATLLDVAERTALVGLPSGTALLNDDAKSLELRIRRLLKPRPTPVTRIGRRMMLATTFLGVALSAIVLATKVQSDESSPTEYPGPMSVSGSEAEPRDPAKISIAHEYSAGVAAQQRVSPRSDSPGQTEESVNLSGKWLLTLPTGFEHRVALAAVGQYRYQLAPSRLNMSGIYELRGSRFDLVEPNDARLTEFKWQAEEPDVLRLVEEPPASKTGAKYTGATLRRLGDAPHKLSDENAAEQQ